jgi:hypothetical protein
VKAADGGRLSRRCNKVFDEEEERKKRPFWPIGMRRQEAEAAISRTPMRMRSTTYGNPTSASRIEESMTTSMTTDRQRLRCVRPFLAAHGLPHCGGSERAVEEWTMAPTAPAILCNVCRYCCYYCNFFLVALARGVLGMKTGSFLLTQRWKEAHARRSRIYLF